MKKTFLFFLLLTALFAFAGCGNQATETETPDPTTPAPTTETPSETEKTLVVYYSATGNTEQAAHFIATATGADIFKIEPVDPYSEDDLNWRDEESRVVYEYNHPEARAVELVASTVENWESYTTVFIGYPIWWGIAAWPMDEFVQTNDFTGKTVIPFCTSSSSELGESADLLAETAGTGTWLTGRRFASAVSEEEIQTWIDELSLSDL